MTILFSNPRRTAARECLRFFAIFSSYRGIWVEPSLLAEIEYRAKSAEVRHPFFKGVREDL
jgi:hypothetical protein